MQTLRKKTSPLKFKNETTRFLGDGVSFKAKLIGILEVSEARGDRMCQEALSDLKMAIRAAGEHKQRITINIAIDGLRLRDEKTGDSLYHHPVHKISFIAQDMTDSRAFGYIFGSPDTGHRFFGIKTDKAASQVVIAMRDLFQVVFALKKKEIELAKQHLDKTRFTNSPLFSDNSMSSTKFHATSHETSKSVSNGNKACALSDAKSGGTAVADLVDLELELSSLQQGLNQMERITPSDPFGSKDDPFGDSFTNYAVRKPILPPPPSSGRDRTSRTSETSSVFSPRTPHTFPSLDSSSADNSMISSRNKKDFSFSRGYNSSHDEHSSGDWFNPPSAGSSIFEEPPLVPEPTKDEKHEMTKQEILSQFDVFTELDPLELKNPPKKVLNDLVTQTQPPEPNQYNRTTNQVTPKPIPDLPSDPFGEDPFVTEDPFAGADFAKQDPFDEFGDFKTKPPQLNNFDAKTKTDHLQKMLHQTNLSKSPRSSMFEKQISMVGASPRNVQFSKQNTFDVQFDKYEKDNKLMHLHENPSLDMSSESECAPEPPPRPACTLMQIKPPPLPPKKLSDLTVRPPPRPPHDEESHYDYMDNYETAPSSLEFIRNIEKSPPLPVPLRKSKFESDFTTVPERPKKNFNPQDSEEDYLTPISFPEKKSVKQSIGGVLLPPPQKGGKKQAASVLETKTDRCNTLFDGLDITLSQLTLSGLNELASKLNIPANQLSNMTLAQLTNFLSNFIKTQSTNNESTLENESNANEFPEFKADFAANFNGSKMNVSESESFDRYAVFRELINEEIKQTRIDTEPEELQEEKQQNIDIEIEISVSTTSVETASEAQDRYAALREIVEIELKSVEPNGDSGQDLILEHNGESNEDTESNIVSLENAINVDNVEQENEVPPKYNLIEYNAPLDSKELNVIVSPLKSPLKSPLISKVKSPVHVAITEIMQNNSRLTSGSLSDVVSGSSPEVDNTASNSEVGKKNEDAAGESWAIFDQNAVPIEIIKEKQPIQSEEGLSPWSSDSKEFNNGSPPDWRRGDSGSGNDHWQKRRGRRDQEGWWDTSAEPEVQYYPNRRSTDSYEEEYYDCYERPRRRKHGCYGHVAQAVGGHSSSSRDVSPWEEEPRRRETRPGWVRHPRQHSFEKHRERRHTDSWDEEDDYEYEDEHIRFHRHSRELERERHGTGGREHEGERWGDDWSDERRQRRRREEDRDRWCCPDWEQGDHEKHAPRYGSVRWPNPNPEGVAGLRRERKYDDRYYSRESQESPWEDDYSNETDEVPPAHFLAAKRNWKRPSSASEMDRKTGEIKTRHYLGTGGSDGERDRRYKPGRRSRSRDSQYAEPSHRHKPPETGTTSRAPHRTKQYSKPQLENDFNDVPSKKQVDSSQLMDHSNKKSTSLASRRKTKDLSPKCEESAVSTFPRKSTLRGKTFDIDYNIPAGDNVAVNPRVCGAKFNFENEFETSEESPIVNKSLKGLRQQSLIEKAPVNCEFSKDTYRQRSLKESKISPRLLGKPKSLFEDDFSPSEKSADSLPEANSISSIKEEMHPNEEDDSFSTNNIEKTTNSRRKKNHKHRLSSGMLSDVHIKKSESVNIFARESDPFDDDFFCENDGVAHGFGHSRGGPSRTTDLKWTEDFEDFDIERK